MTIFWDGHLGYVFAVAFGIYLIRINWRLLFQRPINQILDEVKRGAFDETVTAERLRRLKRRGINVLGTLIPSTLYGLLRQPKLNVEAAVRSEWESLDYDQRLAINEHLSAWLKDMREYSEDQPEDDACERGDWLTQEELAS